MDNWLLRIVIWKMMHKHFMANFFWVLLNFKWRNWILSNPILQSKFSPGPIRSISANFIQISISLIFIPKAASHFYMDNRYEEWLCREKTETRTLFVCVLTAQYSTGCIRFYTLKQSYFYITYQLNFQWFKMRRKEPI